MKYDVIQDALSNLRYKPQIAWVFHLQWLIIRKCTIVRKWPDFWPSANFQKSPSSGVKETTPIGLSIAILVFPIFCLHIKGIQTPSLNFDSNEWLTWYLFLKFFISRNLSQIIWPCFWFHKFMSFDGFAKGPSHDFGIVKLY